jgi:hypothetical protein
MEIGHFKKIPLLERSIIKNNFDSIQSESKWNELAPL